MGCFISKIINNISNTLVNNDKLINEDDFYNLKNNYILYSEVKKNKLQTYNSNELSFEELNNLILSKSLISIITKTKNYLIPTQNNIFKYKNNIYKFNTINKTKVFDLLIRKNIKNVLVPKSVYNKFNMFLEIYDYYEEGDLFNYITQNNLSFNNKLSLIKQITKIIKDIHSINLTHRDIKLENFVIKNINGIIIPILIDFDYANLSNQNLDFKGGTSMYIPPERLSTKINNMKSSDIWALGVIFYTILFNEAIWLISDYNTDVNFKTYCDYNTYNNNLYWKDFIDNTNDIELNYKEKFINIFNYCFNLDYNNRNDILYIYDILF